MQEWRVYSKKADFKALGDCFGIDPVVARIIRNREVIGEEAVNRYINGNMEDLYSPHLMKDMDKGVEIIRKSIENGDRIRIIGDYDIDGICSIYILFKGMKKIGAQVDYDVPDRIIDGYGINENLIKKAYDEGVNTIITCDNGIAAIEQIKYAKSLGMKVVITDHHDVQYEDTDDGRVYIIPDADAVVDPKQVDCEYPFKMLCGAAIAYKFIVSLYESLHMDMDESEEFIVFAAIATIGDIVDLQDENRIIVKTGLTLISYSENPGIKALLAINDLNPEALTAYHIGFVIGPCLNASGRLDTAKRAIELFLSDKREIAEKYAGELKALNDERKKITQIATDKAIELVDNTELCKDKVLVVYISDCHESVAGIVAGRIKEKYYRPTIVLTDGEDGLKGSARSIEGYNIFEKLLECKSLLTKFGGHPMAAGLSLPMENLNKLRMELNTNHGMSEDVLIEKIWIDAPMPIDYVSFKLIEDMKVLAPFGKANEKPVFADKNLTIRQIQSLGKEGKFTKMYLVNNAGNGIEAVGFFDSTELKEAYGANRKISCTYYPEINEYRGNRKLQICITGYRIE